VTVQDFAASAADADRFRRSIDRAVVNAAKSKNGHVLIAVPVRDAADTLDCLFECLLSLHYPRGELSLAFLEGDSRDDSFNRLRVFAQMHANEFRRICVIKREFGVATPTPRWAPAMQRSRRSCIAKVRNELVKQALQHEDWVLWVDADVIGFPDDILTTLLSTGARIVHPNAVRFPGGPSMDLNAWTVERGISPEAMVAWIRDGLYQPPTSFQRLYLSDLRYRDVVPLHTSRRAAVSGEPVPTPNRNRGLRYGRVRYRPFFRRIAEYRSHPLCTMTKGVAPPSAVERTDWRDGI
jgi:hypothetical protein